MQNVTNQNAGALVLGAGTANIGDVDVLTMPVVHTIVDSGSISSVAAANMANNQVLAGVAASTLVAARATRRSVVIKNCDAAITVYIGITAVTVANGLPLLAGESVSIDCVGLIQVIAASGTPTVAWCETYD